MKVEPKKILIIQTAFIGDVILATSLIDYTKKCYPDAKIDFLLRKGNESITQTHINIEKTWIWDKSGGKFKNLFKLIFNIRKEKYDLVLNVQRFFNSGLLTALSGAKCTIGFKQNPMSLFFTKRVEHKIPYSYENTFLHEVQRNVLLLNAFNKKLKLPSFLSLRPSIFPSRDEVEKVSKLVVDNYVVIAPASVWFTKQWPVEKWIELTHKISEKYHVYFIGAPSDLDFIEQIMVGKTNVTNLAGKLNLRESAQLMKLAKRVFVNDSAPLHLASSMNAKVTAIFCSTIPEFGYTPITDDYKVISKEPRLECMPCGLHGHKKCPLGHYKCAYDIDVIQLINTII